MQRPQKNYNPFALIDDTPSAWKGLIGKLPDGFLIFENPMYGVRAGFINLINVYLKSGLNTIEQIFPVYAPSGHGANVPENYIQFVTKQTGINRNTKITTQDQIYKIGKAIVTHEEGKFWVTQKDFDEGFKKAIQSINGSEQFKTSNFITPIIILLLILFLL